MKVEKYDEIHRVINSFLTVLPESKPRARVAARYSCSRLHRHDWMDVSAFGSTAREYLCIARD